MQEEVKHYKVKSLPTSLRPNSVYYVKATSQGSVKTYITDQGGFPYPLIDLASLSLLGIVNSVTGTGVTGTGSNPIINISTFKSSDLGNLIEISSNDGKLFVKPITSPDGSIDINSTSTSLELQLGASLQTQIQNALQSGDNISELTNDAGYITLTDIPTKTSDLTNDGSDNTSTYVETDELGNVAFSNDYNDLDNLPTIPVAQNLSEVLAIGGREVKGVGEIYTFVEEDKTKILVDALGEESYVLNANIFVDGDSIIIDRTAIPTEIPLTLASGVFIYNSSIFESVYLQPNSVAIITRMGGTNGVSEMFSLSYQTSRISNRLTKIIDGASPYTIIVDDINKLLVIESEEDIVIHDYVIELNNEFHLKNISGSERELLYDGTINFEGNSIIENQGYCILKCIDTTTNTWSVNTIIKNQNLEQVATEGSETTIPLVVKEADNSRSTTLLPFGIGFNSDNGNNGFKLEAETPTGITGSGTAVLKDVGDATKTIAFIDDIPSVGDFVPYNGATQNVNLGEHQITSNGFLTPITTTGYFNVLKGSIGGYDQFYFQSVSDNTGDNFGSAAIIANPEEGVLLIKGSDNYLEAINLVEGYIQLLSQDNNAGDDNNLTIYPLSTYSKKLLVSDTGFERYNNDDFGQFYVRQESAQYLGLRFDSYGYLEGTPNTTFLSNSEDGVYMTSNDSVNGKYSSFSLNTNNVNYTVGSGATTSTSQFLFDRTTFDKRIEVPKVLFNSTTETPQERALSWNDVQGTMNIGLKGGQTAVKSGVDLVVRVVNKVSPNTTLTKAAYQAVRISGAQGQRLAVQLAQANNDNNSADTIGLVCETIATNQEGFIMTVGQLENINTTGNLQGETWNDGDVLYLSPTTAGRLTNVKPSAPGHIVVMGYVEYAHQNNGKIYVKIMNGWELDELHNVSINAPLNNQVLTYESATDLWKNRTIIQDTITDGVTTIAPSQNAVFDALNLKIDKPQILKNPSNYNLINTTSFQKITANVGINGDGSFNVQAGKIYNIRGAYRMVGIGGGSYSFGAVTDGIATFSNIQLESLAVKTTSPGNPLAMNGFTIKSFSSTTPNHNTSAGAGGYQRIDGDFTCLTSGKMFPAVSISVSHNGIVSDCNFVLTQIN
jgi:hypothetical protein